MKIRFNLTCLKDPKLLKHGVLTFFLPLPITRQQDQANTRSAGAKPSKKVLDSLFEEGIVFTWYSAKWAGAKRACPSKVMSDMWFMRDAHLGRAFLFLDSLAEYTLLSMTIMVTPCLKYVVGTKLE